MTEEHTRQPRPSLVDRVAARCGVGRTAVERVLEAHAVPASHIPAAPRSLRILRLRVQGTKTTAVDAGIFDRSFSLPAGVSMIVGPNLRGKTSLLEILTLCLRGQPRDLQSDVASWLSAVECDLELNGRPVGLRLQLSEGTITTAQVLEADDAAALAAAGAPRARVLVEVASGEEYARAIDTFMLTRLGLEPIMAADGRGGVQTHR
ncbi:AAA family ATPase [Kineococcus sp. SYSU DK006]|uniref:AAA family ATPase n=1 Tax=Kineococcus sp. SYSU DK006 TaxID=3383127 RepID=UPI003D7EE24A